MEYIVFYNLIFLSGQIVIMDTTLYNKIHAFFSAVASHFSTQSNQIVSQ